MGKTIDNVKTTAKLTGLAALCVAATGCLGSAIITGYGAQTGNPGAYAFGNALNQTEAAKSGRTTIVVPQGNRQPNNTDNDYKWWEDPNNFKGGSNSGEELPLVITCGGTKDEIIEGADVKERGKRVFYSGEWVGIIATDKLAKIEGNLENETFYLSTGKGLGRVSKNAAKGGPGIACPIYVDKILLAAGEGEYENRWYLNGNQIYSVRFTVLRNKPGNK